MLTWTVASARGGYRGWSCRWLVPAVTVFADSSALVKRYADEPGSDALRALLLLVVSAPAKVEVPAALWRKARTSFALVG